ncbi:hypothetical protein, partial [Salmonella enterica]|uniref:hypothetical protein n=1 Tax=Salmonella enterica TaxID=28901 RepID=UPI001EE7D2C7
IILTKLTGFEFYRFGLLFRGEYRGDVNIIAPGGAVGLLTKGNTTLMPDGDYALSGIWFCVR